MPSIQEDGFSILPSVFSTDEMDALLEHIPSEILSMAGSRHALRNPHIRSLAHDARLASIAKRILGSEALPFRATLFSKTTKANWLVVWHQDKALPVRDRREVAGWGPWTTKGGVCFANAPSRELGRVLALRVHLDECTTANGPLRVLPGTHSLGVLNEAQVHEFALRSSPFECIVPKGGVLAMRPLLIHSSSKARTREPRRVLHIEYAASCHTDDGMELAIG